MPVVKVNWTWEEAFDKFGFGDGDGLNMTDKVAAAISRRFPTLEVTMDTWGIHNYIIFAIVDKRTKKSVYIPVPDDVDEWNIGYDGPRAYLPNNIVRFLDRTFPNKPRRRKKRK